MGEGRDPGGGQVHLEVGVVLVRGVVVRVLDVGVVVRDGVGVLGRVGVLGHVGVGGHVGLDDVGLLDGLVLGLGGGHGLSFFHRLGSGRVGSRHCATWVISNAAGFCAVCGWSGPA